MESPEVRAGRVLETVGGYVPVDDTHRDEAAMTRGTEGGGWDAGRLVSGPALSVSESKGPGHPVLLRDLAMVGDHLSLFRRWYYRPEKQRKGRGVSAERGWKLAGAADSARARRAWRWASRR